MITSYRLSDRDESEYTKREKEVEVDWRASRLILRSLFSPNQEIRLYGMN